MRKIFQIISRDTYKSYGISIDEFLDELIIKDKENRLLHEQEKELLRLKNNYDLKQNNMKTKLEIGTEYWLDKCEDESGVFVGLDCGYLLFKPSKNCVLYVADDGYVKLSDDGRIYTEVKHQNPWQFTTPIAMKCTEDQFNGIKDKLVDMGYSPSFITFMSDNRYLCTAYGLDSKIISDFSKLCIENSDVDRIVFDEFNPALFLALAAMTDKEDGINGEWWIGTSGGKLFEQSLEKNLNSTGVFRKATAQEIIEHFEKKEFVLPEKWFVRPRTEENLAILVSDSRYSEYKAFKISNIDNSYTSDFVYRTDPRLMPSNYSEITFDQFKKYVLKETPQSCQIIPIPPSKQATLFEDRVEITDWEPKDNDEVLVVSINVDGWGFTKTKYKFVAEPYKAHGFIKRTESEAKQLVERLKQAML